VIIIFGLRRLKKGMGSVLLRCANCGMSPLALLRVSTWFALFFIPVIPVSFKHYAVCPNCKRLDQVSKADVERARTQESTIRASGQQLPVDVASQPATLEHAVHEWAAAGPAQMGASDPAPATPPVSAGVASPPPAPPAGWYADPAGGSRHRYWDGQRWTERTAPPPPSP
jgi:hypothetical protein